MVADIEETLGRELREVADGLQIPARLPLPSGARRRWQPLLVASCVALIVAGTVGVVATVGDGREPAPAPPGRSESDVGSPTTEPDVVTIPRSAPTIPYVLDQRLYVDGERVPGTWWSVTVGDTAWLALRSDDTWWWGHGPERQELTGRHDVSPVISPNGAYVAAIGVENGHGVLTGLDTTTGETLGSVSVNPGDSQDGSTVQIWAVTNDGKVIVQGTNSSLLWLPLAGNATVDLTVTAPGLVVMSSTPAGPIVFDGQGDMTHEGAGEEPYLAEISDAGEFTRVGSVPPHDDLLVSPGAAWLVWTPLGSTGGEVLSIPTLEAQTVDGTQQTTLTAPTGWAFSVREWTWEDDDHLVSPVVSDGDGVQRLARCSVQPARCVLIKTQ